MGASLLDTYPSTLETIQRLDRHLSMFKENDAPLWKIEDLLRDSDKAGLVNEPEYSQPLCTAVQIMLVDLLARWGVRPAATIGHSSGKLRYPHPLLLIFFLFSLTCYLLR